MATPTPTPTPALKPPDGQTSNFDNPQSLLKWDAVAVSVCLSITTILFLLRVYVRAWIKKTWVLEDCKLPTICAVDISVTFY